LPARNILPNLAEEPIERRHKQVARLLALPQAEVLRLPPENRLEDESASLLILFKEVEEVRKLKRRHRLRSKSRHKAKSLLDERKELIYRAAEFC
jgi:hypothetical protein